MVKRTVTVDTYAWMTPVEGVPGRFQHNTAKLGDVIEVSAQEAERGEKLDALSTSTAAAAKVAAKASEPAAWSDEQINSANADDVIAYVGQRPSEAERVRDLEAGRPKGGRKTVAEALERIIAARDEAIAEAADRRDAATAADLEDAAARAGASGAPAIP